MSRVVIILVTGFWLTMNVLLWQTEFGSRKNGGTVPVETVWEKILTAADDSSLTIFHQGKLVGACHLRTAVGEEWSRISDENMPAAPPDKARGYHLRVDGSAVVPQLTNRVRFEGELKLGKGREWQELNARVTMRPVTWEIHSIATQQTVHLKAQGPEEGFNVVLQFSDLKNPAILTYKLLGPTAAELAAEAGLHTGPNDATVPALGLKWEAQEDLIRIGRTAVQVYRLHTRVLDRYEVTAIVSRAGEILRVELPDEVTLVNDRMAATGEGTSRKSTRVRNPLPDLSLPQPND
jgi:hypothetical protein